MNIKTVELFAGVGGFHLGLNKIPNAFDVVWSNQWEPSTKKQHASLVYQERFKNTPHSNNDIATVIENDFETIPNHDLLVGGFPCQDYSVARTLSKSQGLQGKKGVLWWSIYDIITKKGKNAPKYLMLENVDRLLKSPAQHRGRDFAVMLASLSDLGYIVEWRVVNAAEFGMPQRRRRVYIMAYKKDTPIYEKIQTLNNPQKWLTHDGVMQKAFNFGLDHVIEKPFTLEGDLAEISENEVFNTKKSPFNTVGIMIDRAVYSAKGIPMYEGNYTTLANILQEDTEVNETFYLKKDTLERWNYLKGSKSEQRTSANGHCYHYSEGAMVFPDALDNASRTIVTGEGGSSASRFKHVVKTKKGLRRLTPVELERLNMFPDNHTKSEHVSDAKRAFFMGNALVVGVIEKLAKALVDELTFE